MRFLKSYRKKTPAHLCLIRKMPGSIIAPASRNWKWMKVMLFLLRIIKTIMYWMLALMRTLTSAITYNKKKKKSMELEDFLSASGFLLIACTELDRTILTVPSSITYSLPTSPMRPNFLTPCVTIAGSSFLWDELYLRRRGEVSLWSMWKMVCGQKAVGTSCQHGAFVKANVYV